MAILASADIIGAAITSSRPMVLYTGPGLDQPVVGTLAPGKSVGVLNVVDAGLVWLLVQQPSGAVAFTPYMPDEMNRTGVAAWWDALRWTGMTTWNEVRDDAYTGAEVWRQTVESTGSAIGGALNIGAEVGKWITVALVALAVLYGLSFVPRGARG